MEIKKTINKERIILLGMILSEKFLKGISGIFDEAKKCFATEHTKTVAQWSWDYYVKYKKAPVEDIKNIYEVEKEKLSDDNKRSIELFLESISEEYRRTRKFNDEYALDIAEEYFKYRSLTNLKSDLAKNLSVNNIEIAENLVEQYTSKIAMKTVSWVDPLSEERIRNLFDYEEKDKLFKLPGKLGDIIGSFEREFLVAIVGKPGIGKTWMLLFIALHALVKGHNVLFVNLELSARQLEKRIYQFFTARPTKKTKEVEIPVFDCTLNQDNSCRRDERTSHVKIGEKGYLPCDKCREDKTLWQREVYFKAIRRREISQNNVLAKIKNLLAHRLLWGGQIRTLTYPSGALTVGELRRQISLLVDYEGFIPDLIVTDYADKFKSHLSKDQYRFQIKEIWEGHKAIAQEYHCVVATASQSSAARKDEDTKDYDWAESVFKKDLIDVGITLNRSREDFKRGILRAGIAKHRHDGYDIDAEVAILQSLTLGRQYLDSEIVF